jgi:hypothetical protein
MCFKTRLQLREVVSKKSHVKCDRTLSSFKVGKGDISGRPKNFTRALHKSPVLNARARTCLTEALGITNTQSWTLTNNLAGKFLHLLTFPAYCYVSPK